MKMFEKKWEERWSQGPQRGPANPLFTENDLSEDFPTAWSFDEFKNLTSFAARIRYVESFFKPISSGSARKVFKMDDKHALKLAYNKKGLAQNRDEVDFYKEAKAYEILMPIDDFDDENYHWVMMELGEKPTSEDFKRNTGLKIKTFLRFISSVVSVVKTGRVGFHMSKSEYNYYLDRVDDYEFLELLVGIIDNYSDRYNFGDLGRKNSYAVRNGKLYVVDYGLTHETFDTMYMKENNKKNTLIITENQKEKLSFKVHGLNGDMNDFEILNNQIIAIENKLNAIPVGELNVDILKKLDKKLDFIDDLIYKLNDYLYKKGEREIEDDDDFLEFESALNDKHQVPYQNQLKLSSKINNLLDIFNAP